MRNVPLTVSSVRIARPPRRTPTASAAGRFRPGLSVRGSPLSWPESGGMGCWGSSSSRKLDLEEFGFLVLQQLIHLGDVGVRQLIKFPLGPAAVVLPCVAALHELVDRVLGGPADVADRDPDVLGLAAGDLDVLLAPFLGQVRKHVADER